MAIANEIKKEVEAYENGPLKDLTVQDSLIIIAVYAAQMDPQNCEKDVKRIEAIAESYPEFVEKRKDIFSRINKYVNSMQVMDPQKAVEIAANTLNPELKKTAFKLAAEVALPNEILTDEKKAVLDTIATKLSINREFAQQVIEKSTK